MLPPGVHRPENGSVTLDQLVCLSEITGLSPVLSQGSGQIRERAVSPQPERFFKMSKQCTENLDTATPVFIAALSTIARKQPRCPLTDEWIRKLWYIYIMEYSSAIERDWWMNLEPIIQSEVSQKEKDKYRILMHIYGI